MLPSTRLAVEHLALRLRPLHRALRAAVERQAVEAAQLTRPDLTPYCITDEQVDQLLERVDGWALPEDDGQAPLELTRQERAAEQRLRDQAAAAGRWLPLDELAGRLELADDELQALLLCAAPELDRAYERIFAYVLDDLNRRLPCAELLAAVTARSGFERLARRRLLGRAGRLRRLGLLRPHGEAPSELRQELRLAPGLVEFLLGSGGDLAVLAHDPGAVQPPEPSALPAHVDPTQVERLGTALGAGTLDLVGVWGPVRAGQHEVVLALAQAAASPLRQLPPAGTELHQLGAAVGEALEVAAALGAILWITTDRLVNDDQRQAVGELLARSATPTCLSGAHPWRPTAALCARAYGEIAVMPPPHGARKAMWSSALPALDAPRLDDLAARYRLSGQELRAVTALAQTDALARSNGDPPDLGDAVERAVAAVAQRPTNGLAQGISPRRRLDDLVLPPDQQQTVREVAAAFRAWPRVAEAWGFAGRSGGGVKALFTGEPGTGKTLAAEAIAGTLGLHLLKVDMARIVSKWVGETEKHLEAAFEQAEDSQSVLFFDEADALFGRRGEIKHGIDRYANLEVGYLLQRLEQSDALVILASNLKENIDPAFTRRFHYIVQFPRPTAAERRRIWRLAFPPDAPLAPEVDLAALAQLDMTGASIAGAARTAALLAADAVHPTITMADAVRGVSRQYQREARLLRPAELGRYARLVAPP